MNRTKKIARMLTLALVGLMATGAADAAQVVLRDGRVITGKDIRLRPNGDVIITTVSGQLTFTKAQYVQAVADEPPEYKQALGLAAQKRPDEAITVLKKIIMDYRGLQWDSNARVALAGIYVQKGDPETARITFEEIFTADPKARENPEIIWPYRETLLKAKKYAALEPDLDQVTRSGSRTDAARAQNMRGDIRKAQNQMEAAFFDYMRTAMFFKDVKEYQPEALFKAAECLEAMRDARAQKLFQQVVQDYPDSPYAQQAQGRM